MSKTPEENRRAVTQTSLQHNHDQDEDESTLSPELAKLEHILSRKQTASVEGIKNDI